LDSIGRSGGQRVLHPHTAQIADRIAARKINGRILSVLQK
jgi:hypothetical protein